MLLGLLFLGLVPAAFMAEGFISQSEEVEPDEGLPIGSGGETMMPGDEADGGTADADTTVADTPDTTIEGQGAANTDDGEDGGDGEEVIGDVLDPIDEPGEGAPSDLDATLLDSLLAENTDAVYGLPDYDHFSRDPDPLQLGDGDDEHVGSSDGVPSDAALKLFHGTPYIELEEDLVGVIDGEGGDDTITSGDDASFVFGGEGDDKLIIASAPAAAFGGEGDDDIISTYTAGENENSGYLDGGLGNDSVTGGDGVDLIFGGQHDDTGEGPDNDTLSGGAGDDQISGGYGSDVIAGDDGDDVLNHLGHAMENSGAERSSFDWHIDNEEDVLDGGEGNDTLIIDRADVATGGEGADNFHLYFDHETGDGHADVTDFASGEDFLRITLNPDVDPDSVELDVSPSEDGNDGVVTVNGEVVAVLQGAPDATAADIYLEVMTEVYV